MFEGLNSRLKGQPNRIITGMLFLVAAIAILVAIYAKPTLKAAVMTWFVAP